MELTAGQAILINNMPHSNYNGGELDGPSIKKIFEQIAKTDPDNYPKISHKLNKLGVEIAYRAGASIDWDQLAPSTELDDLRNDLKKQIEEILDNDSLNDSDKQKKIVSLLNKYDDLFLEKTKEVYKKRGGNIYSQIASGARGKWPEGRRLITGDVVYVDHRDNTLPIPALSGFSKGLSPAEYIAASYGARRGWIQTNLGTATAGYTLKQLMWAAHDLMVTDIDGPDKFPLPRGLPVETDNPDNVGALLAVDTAQFKRNTILTPEILAQLKKQGINKILIRSVLIRRSPQGGVYSRDVGLYDTGKLLSPGELVGVTASQAIGEPVTQMVIGAKHSGGTGKTKVDISTLQTVLQVAKKYKGAVHSTETGVVSRIKDAPAGGKIVVINSTEHYVPPNEELLVKEGDQVEAGDRITNGIPNPAMLTQYKGLGEGRRQLVRILSDIYNTLGFKIRRRNFELMVAGLLNHAMITRPWGNFIPGEVAKYSWIEENWEPRENSKWVPPEKALGKYLEYPVLHYTIGTRLLPSMVKELREYGIDSVLVHDEPPPFTFFMPAAASWVNYETDWLTRFLGGTMGGERSLRQAIMEGQGSSLRTTSFVAPLVTGETFAREWPYNVIGKRDERVR